MVRKIQGVTATAAVDRHARPGDRPGRPAGLRPRPGRRQEADPQLGQRPAGRRCSICTGLRPFRPILLVSENVVDGRSASLPHRRGNLPGGPAVLVATRSWPAAPGRTNDDCIIDPGIAPIGSDSEGNIQRLVAAMGLIHADPDFAGCHASVGLSNFTVMLPPKRRRRLAGQRPAGERLSHQGHAAGPGHGDRLGEAELRIACRPTTPPCSASKRCWPPTASRG